MTTPEAVSTISRRSPAICRGACGARCWLPADAGYDEARSIWNAMIDRRPALIVRCLGVADVIACVQRRARSTGCCSRIKGGGHNIAGLAVCDGGLMLDMSLMRGVWVDPRQRRGARAGRLPARRRRPRDAAARPRRGARLRLEHRLRRADARRRVRLPHAALRLDQRQRRGDGPRHRRRARWCARPSARTATCSGGCAAAAATSASSPASTTRSTRSARRSSAAPSPGAARSAAAVLEMYRDAGGRGAAAS